MDTMDVIDFDRELFYAGLSVLNSNLPVFEVSCKTGEGFPEWTAWLLEKYAIKFPQCVA